MLLGRSYEVICGWVLLLLDFLVLGRCYCVNQGWQLLASGLGPFGRQHNAAEASCILCLPTLSLLI